MSKTFTDEELADLTAEERAALLEGDTSEDGEPDSNEADDDGSAAESGAKANAGDGSDKKTVEDADDDAAKAEDGQAKQDDAAKPVEAAAQPATRSAPVLTAAAPENADAKLKEIADKRAELRKKYNDGDMEFDEYESARDQLIEQADEIKFAMRKADLAAEMERQRHANEWQATCDAFLASHAEYADDALLSELDDAVKAIAALKSSAGLSGDKILEKAHRFVQAEHGNIVAEQKAAPAAAAPAQKPKKPAPELPPTLAKMPASDVSDTGGNRFAAIERLQGEELEEAVAKLSAADREAWRAGV